VGEWILKMTHMSRVRLDQRLPARPVNNATATWVVFPVPLRVGGWVDLWLVIHQDGIPANSHGS